MFPLIGTGRDMDVAAGAQEPCHGFRMAATAATAAAGKA
jgi:hypothetical protein